MALEKDKLRVSHKLIAAQLVPYTRKYNALAGDLFRTGMELFLLDQAYPDQLPEVLEVKPKRLEQLEKQLPKLKEKLASGKKLRADEQRYLSLSFARALAYTYPFQGLLKSPAPDILKRLVEFIQPPEKEPAVQPGGDGEGTGKRKKTKSSD